MSKELEALELIKLDYGVEPQGYELIKSALEQKEKLEHYIAKLIKEDNKKCRKISKLCDKLCQLEKAFDILSKEDEKAKKLLSLEIEKNRAFEIIKNKVVDIDYFMNCETLKEYNDEVLAYYFYDEDDAEWRMLTQKEFTLLKKEL